MQLSTCRTFTNAYGILNWFGNLSFIKQSVRSAWHSAKFVLFDGLGLFLPELQS